MKIFSKEEFVNFVRNDEMIYIDNVDLNSEDNNFDYDMKVVNNVFDGDGVYSLMFGSRGEVEFVKVIQLMNQLNGMNQIMIMNLKVQLEIGMKMNQIEIMFILN